MITRISVPHQTHFFEGSQTNGFFECLKELVKSIQKIAIKVLQTLLPCFFKQEPENLPSDAPATESVTPVEPRSQLSRRWEALQGRIQEFREAREESLRLSEEVRRQAEERRRIQHQLRDEAQVFLREIENTRPSALDPLRIRWHVDQYMGPLATHGDIQELPEMSTVLRDYIEQQVRSS